MVVILQINLLFQIPVCYWNLADLPDIKSLSSKEICRLVRERAERLKIIDVRKIIVIDVDKLYFKIYRVLITMGMKL